MHLTGKAVPADTCSHEARRNLGLSHGFLLGVLQNDGVDFREDINVILNAPKAGAAIIACNSLAVFGH